MYVNSKESDLEMSEDHLRQRLFNVNKTVTIEGEDLIIAQEVVRGSKVLTIRDET